MTPDFKPIAVDFVRRNQCATNTPVELIVKAMEEGAAESMRLTTERLNVVLKDLREQRARNIGK